MKKMLALLVALVFLSVSAAPVLASGKKSSGKYDSDSDYGKFSKGYGYKYDSDSDYRKFSKGFKFDSDSDFRKSKSPFQSQYKSQFKFKQMKNPAGHHKTMVQKKTSVKKK